MRFSVRYRVEDRRWLVIDTAAGDQIVSDHASKAEAYRQVSQAQTRWRTDNPTATATNYLARVREILPRTLTMLASRGKISAA